MSSEVEPLCVPLPFVEIEVSMALFFPFSGDGAGGAG